MWELGNLWADNRNPSSLSASYHVITNEIHVLLVEHESEGLLNTAKMLELCQYRVTLVELASAAISMLMSGKAKFDVVIANINSPDLHGIKLLQHAVSMSITTIVTSNDDNTYMAMRALECGAFLYVKKPLTMELLKCLWQHVLREKTRMMNNMVTTPNNGPPLGAADLIRDVENPINMEMVTTMVNMNKGKTKRNGDRDHQLEYDHQDRRTTNNGNVKRKMCTEWTHELHAKFMRAVEELGEGRCFPKEILELMNVPGLTRMQVASHLQKCRNDNWRSPLERKSQQAPQPVSSEPNGCGQKPRRFGSKPLLKTHDLCAPEQGSETHSENEMTPPLNNASYYYHQQNYAAMGPGPGTAQLGANHRQSGEELFSFQDVDCLIQNFSGLHHPCPAPGAYNFGPTYHEQQNSVGPSVESKSQWSSDTSNFESEESAETNGPLHLQLQ